MKSVFNLFFVLFFSSVFSQNPYGSVFSGEMLIIDYRGSFKGKSFIYDEWNRGMLVLNDSVFSKQDFLQYDTYKNRVLIKNIDNLKEIIEITDKSLTGFCIIEKKRNLKHDFVKLNSSDFKGFTESGFYEIVFNIQNTNYFIKRNTKILFDPNRSKGTMTHNNLPLELKDKTIYYIKNNNGLYVKVRLKRKDIKAVLTENTKLIDTYIKREKIRMSKESDVMKLVNYYYSL
ncbi:MAG: hypothetical protein L3J45_01780 [Flavobacteriaceae bacterium]|nr:hypothetical protein [Flavobacteriaceae bacterium]